MEQNKNVISNIRKLVMAVDDEIVNREILEGILSEKYDVLKAESAEKAFELLDKSVKPISLILLDINMPNMNGFEFLEKLKQNEEHKRIPVIVLTSEKSYELKSLHMGAADFLNKPLDMPEIVIARVDRSIELSEDKQIIKRYERDILTGVYSSNMFAEYCLKMDSYSADTLTDTVVINIEKFHIYNELYGRDEGDRVLKALADALKNIVRHYNGIVGRLQSDYFVCYIEHIDDPNALLSLIYQRMRDTNGINNLRLRIGFYPVTDKNESVNVRIDRAKTVCDSLRNSNKDSTKVYDSEAEQFSLFREKLAHDMFRAIKEEQFTVYYQPKYNISGERPRLVSAEALVRWTHPDAGFISPGVFIPLFEENGLIRFLDRFVWKKSAEQLSAWRKEYGIDLSVSVNISRIDLLDPELPEVIADCASENGIDPKNLLLEITESAYNGDNKQNLRSINALREKGFKIEIDDFGSGYSSLNSIATLPFDILKLDMLFVKEMYKNEKMLKMVNIVSDIGRLLEVPLVAEGVETEDQYLMLKDMGYEIIQGYYFAKPVPAEQFVEYIRKELAENGNN